MVKGEVPADRGQIVHGCTREQEGSHAVIGCAKGRPCGGISWALAIAEPAIISHGGGHQCIPSLRYDGRVGGGVQYPERNPLGHCIGDERGAAGLGPIKVVGVGDVRAPEAIRALPRAQRVHEVNEASLVGVVLRGAACWQPRNRVGERAGNPPCATAPDNREPVRAIFAVGGNEGIVPVPQLRGRVLEPASWWPDGFAEHRHGRSRRCCRFSCHRRSMWAAP